MDMTILDPSGPDSCPPKNVDAVVFRAAPDDSSVDEYYDEVGDFKVELSRAFNWARLWVFVSCVCVCLLFNKSILFKWKQK